MLYTYTINFILTGTLINATLRTLRIYTGTLINASQRRKSELVIGEEVKHKLKNIGKFFKVDVFLILKIGLALMLNV